MWIAFGAALVSLLLKDRKRLICFIALSAACLLFTAFTFSYVGTDVMSYHFPMQDLLRHGWNPVYTATIEEFDVLVNGWTLNKIHALFLPRLNALCGALMGASTGLYIADSFLNYAMVFSLLATAFDFSRRFWRLNPTMSVLFALCVTCTTKFTAFLSGYADYLSYAGIMIMLFTAVLYIKERRIADLWLFGIAFAVSSLAKSTGLVVAVLWGLLILPVLFKDRSFWVAALIIAVYVIIVGFSPLMTSLINYSCPFYPTMSFSSAHPVIDITSDFTGNADALKMGYVARTLYAWVSPALAVKLCSVAYGQPDFMPEFTVCGGVAGFGAAFRVMLLLGAVALVFSKKNLVTVVCLFVFLTTLVTPLKYVGFSRYFLQIWAVPILALFNLAANPSFNLRNGAVKMGFRALVVFAPVAIAFLCIMRSIAFYGRSIAEERCRQAAISCLKAKSSVWGSDGKIANSYSLSRRLSVGGINYLPDRDIAEEVPRFSYDGQYMWAAIGNARAEAVEVDEEFPLVNSPMEILRFPWRKAYSGLPHVLWSGFGCK